MGMSPASVAGGLASAAAPSPWAAFSFFFFAAFPLALIAWGKHTRAFWAGLGNATIARNDGLGWQNHRDGGSTLAHTCRSNRYSEQHTCRSRASGRSSGSFLGRLSDLVFPASENLSSTRTMNESDQLLINQAKVRNAQRTGSAGLTRLSYMNIFSLFTYLIVSASASGREYTNANLLMLRIGVLIFQGTFFGRQL
jgi:hypothetical protein